MRPSSRTPEGEPNRCPVCGVPIDAESSRPPGDAACPHCGSLLWQADNPLAGLPFLAHEARIAEFEASDKSGCLRELVEALHAAGRLSQVSVEEIHGLLLEREQLGSTGIGRGYAVPHTKHPDIDQMSAAIGCSSRGIEFNSLDGEPVHAIVLLVSPFNQPREHLQALEMIARRLRSATHPSG